MKKVLRKILTLSLVLVLICLCGVNAFAASYSDSDTYGRYTINASFSINEKSTSGTVFLTDNGTLITSSYLYASVTYRYNMTVGINPVTITQTDNETKTYDYQASASFEDQSIIHMVSATYTFAADIPGVNGAQRHYLTPDTIYYP